MRALIGRIDFNTNSRRNQAVNRANNQATTRGLVAYPLNLDGATVNGTRSGSFSGRPCMWFSFKGPDADVEAAYEDLFNFMDNQNWIGEDSWSGTVFVKE